jgi:hypothetical protein
MTTGILALIITAAILAQVVAAALIGLYRRRAQYRGLREQDLAEVPIAITPIDPSLSVPIPLSADVGGIQGVLGSTPGV